MAKLRITQGDDKSFAVQFPDGTDLTGCTVYFTVKPESNVRDTDPTDANAVIKVEESAHNHPDADPINGLTVLTLTAAETGAAAVGEYVYDIQLKNTGGNIKTYKKSNGELPPCEVTPQSTQRSD